MAYVMRFKIEADYHRIVGDLADEGTAEHGRYKVTACGSVLDLRLGGLAFAFDRPANVCHHCSLSGEEQC